MNEDCQMFDVTAKQEAEKNEFTIAQLNNNFGTVLDIINNHNYIKVEGIKDRSYVGFLHSFDPVTCSIILSIPQGDGFRTDIVPGHTIINISLEEVPANTKPPQKKTTQTESTEDVLYRKTKLISWFKTNLLPVTELNNKIIIGNVSLLPPYNISDISTDNPIVAMQIKDVIEKMPEDYEPK